jgi:hypothetical protein
MITKTPAGVIAGAGAFFNRASRASPGTALTNLTSMGEHGSEGGQCNQLLSRYGGATDLEL